MSKAVPLPNVDRDQLREAIKDEYREVARSPDQGFHFHTGRSLTRIVGYRDEWLERVPEDVIACFAGTGNPFLVAELQAGERVVDLGCGAGIDTFIAAKQVGGTGRVVGVDMTEEMLARARSARSDAGIDNIEFREGHLEEVPIEDGWADVVISNGAINLAPDKARVYGEINRVLKAGGRMQVADILVQTPVSSEAKERIDLWTG